MAVAGRYAVVDLSHENARGLLEVVSGELQTVIGLAIAKLEAGPFLQAALLDRCTEKTRQAALVIHHLATDWASWRILISELFELCQADAQDAVRLPPLTSSYRRWSEWLTESSHPESVLSELVYWEGVAKHPIHPVQRLNCGFPDWLRASPCGRRRIRRSRPIGVASQGKCRGSGAEEDGVAVPAGDKLHSRIGLALVGLKAQRQFAVVGGSLRDSARPIVRDPGRRQKQRSVKEKEA